MALSIKNTIQKFIQLFPLLFLFYISLSGNSLINLKYFTINISYIIVYYWVLRKPEALGYGFIFLAGIITDVIFGFPLGANALSLLVISGVAAYVRLVTVRITLLGDWISFFPALIFTNLIYFLSLYFLNFEVDYFILFINSISTLCVYPLLWVVFSIFLNISKS